MSSKLLTVAAATVLAAPATAALAAKSSGTVHSHAAAGTLLEGTAAPQDVVLPGGRRAEGFVVRAQATGEARGIEVDLRRATRGASLAASIFTDSAGRPGHEVTSGRLRAVGRDGWTQVAIRHARLLAGRRYWITLTSGEGRIVVADAFVSRSLPTGRPRNLVPVTLTGPAVVGDTLRTTTGTWAGNPTLYAYGWSLCRQSSDECSSIPGANAATYTPTAADAGLRLRSEVVAWNPEGDASAESAASAPVQAAEPTTTTTSTSATTTSAATTSATTTSTTTTSTTTTSTTSSGSTMTTSTTSSGSIGPGVTFTPIDGGADYFASKDAGSAWLDGHILLAGWMLQPEDVQQVQNDAAMGLNLYWNLGGQAGTDNPVADYDVIRQGGMHVIAPDWDATSGSETVGFQGVDEADMLYGAGSANWENGGSSSGCEPSSATCGYTAANFFYSGADGGVEGASAPSYPIGTRIVSSGFGKGVLFWDEDAEAAKFLNYSDILSADSYWMTDPDLQAPSQGGCALLPQSATACGNGSGSGLTPAQAELPANYGWNVTRLRQLEALDGGSKPIAVDVETGCPFSDSGRAGRCTTPAAAIAGAWHALIAGARGIIWFQHNFSGPCFDDHTFADGMDPTSANYNCQQTPGVTLHDLDEDITGFDDEVTSLNAALLSPTANGYVSTSGDVATMAKAYGGACYVFAGSGQPGVPPAANQSVSFSLADGYTGPVTVLDENRTVEATRGLFTDTFADADAVHVYEIPGSGC